MKKKSIFKYQASNSHNFDNLKAFNTKLLNFGYFFCEESLLTLF